MSLISDTEAWRRLKAHVDANAGLHLRDLLADADRNASLFAEFDGIAMDFSRQRVRLGTPPITPRAHAPCFDPSDQPWPWPCAAPRPQVTAETMDLLFDLAEGTPKKPSPADPFPCARGRHGS